MPVFAKFDGVDGESNVSTGGGGGEDRFQFKNVKKSGDDGYAEVEWTYSKGPSPDGYLIITMENLTDSDRSGDAGPLPSEDFTMNYTEVEWT